MDVEEITIIRKLLREELAELLNIRVPSRDTVPLRSAAQLCNVEYRWLLEKIQRQEIPAFRPDPASCWRVYISDVNLFLTRTTNLESTQKKVARKLHALR